MKHFKDEIHYIPDELDIYSDEYKKWKEEFLDYCSLYARHIMADKLEREEYEKLSRNC